MNSPFFPRLEILPSAQQALWRSLAPLQKLGFVLYGGTAIALRVGHRQSIDFDFFSDRALDKSALRADLPELHNALTLEESGSGWTVLVPAASGDDSVRLSFFGPIGFGRVGTPDVTADGVMQVASLIDLMATKLKVMLQRAEAKDYRDVAAMLAAGVDLAEGLAAARALFGPNFQPSESMKALAYHDDGDLAELTATERLLLINASIAVRDLPEVTTLSKSLPAA